MPSLPVGSVGPVGPVGPANVGIDVEQFDPNHVFNTAVMNELNNFQKTLISLDQEIADINNIIKKTGALSTNDLAKLINFNTKDKADPSFEYPEQLEKNICEKIADALIQPGEKFQVFQGRS